MSGFKHEPHTPVKVSGIPWPVCRGCGLVFLRNKITEWCKKYGCNHTEHPGFRNAVAALTRSDAHEDSQS